MTDFLHIVSVLLVWTLISCFFYFLLFPWMCVFVCVYMVISLPVFIIPLYNFICVHSPLLPLYLFPESFWSTDTGIKPGETDNNSDKIKSHTDLYVSHDVEFYWRNHGAWNNYPHAIIVPPEFIPETCDINEHKSVKQVTMYLEEKGKDYEKQRLSLFIESMTCIDNWRPIPLT